MGRSEPILHNDWIICSHLLYFNSKKVKGLNSMSLIRFQSVLYDSDELFSIFQNFVNLKTEDLIFWGRRTSCTSALQFFNSGLLYFSPSVLNYKDFQNSFLLITFQCILCFPVFENFIKLKRGPNFSFLYFYCKKLKFIDLISFISNIFKLCKGTWYLG